MTPAIETRILQKTFGSTRAVAGIDLEIGRGAVYGLLGPNGAGKTTTIRVLATLLKPDGGSASVLGLDVVKDAAAVRAKVSLTGQFASVDEDLTGHENLVLVARLLGFTWAGARARARELLEAFGLAEAAGRQVRTWSGGMRRRLDIAASLVRRLGYRRSYSVLGGMGPGGKTPASRRPRPRSLRPSGRAGRGGIAGRSVPQSIDSYI
ncbi:caunorubicin/doxorubicin resistance ATP-binding protein [Sulfurifustis variabilis]|uniref:Caunorubicin/doxorubicin resistance ATP-binding protein n=1 Tax=Sulfurifustis variabilis TaxID=1675686 RepID=A0A1B4V6L5_9GAMM|nr:ATP-binding cassette domain-containing protein [Sulfurifustis variabilis]BAU49158.1 caunorubicin/doxorubicin resistance ATP-binding protein [Sulfurifustis variabilis]